MKILLITFFAIIVSSQLIAQPSHPTQQFTLPQIGLTFSVPVGFIMTDSSSSTMNPTPEILIWRKQFIFKKEEASYIVSISTSTQKDIDWNNVYKKEAKQFYDQTRIRKPETKFDSSSTIVMIGSQSFNKFIVTGKENAVIIYNHVQLSKFYKDYKVNIAYNFTKKENEDDIENSLKDLKFE